MMRLLPVLSLATLAFCCASSEGGLIVVGSLVRTATIESGETFGGVIFLKNTDPEQAVDVRISQTDYAFRADGSNDYGDAGTAARSNADWITLSPTLVRLAPGETRPVRYKGQAPADQGLRGTFWSMIMVEPDSTPAPATHQQEGVGLQTKIRFGIQIVTEVGQGGRRSLQILDKRMAKEGVKRGLELDIGNDGERVLIPQISVELFDQSGLSVGVFPAGRVRVYPSCSVRAKVDLTDVPAGRYAALLLLDSGDSQVLGAQYDIEIE